MKHPVIESATGRGILACVAAALLCGGAPTALRGQVAGEAASPPADRPAASVAPENARLGKKLKKALDSDDSRPTPGAKKLKEIPFPLSPGDDANRLKIPEMSTGGNLLSQLMAAKATRLDNEHVQMHEMNLDLYHPDGKEDFHIIMPTSVFNLHTRVITSDDPVTVRTQDFELTGEKMEFNTVDRTGKLIGKVRMLIHNLKQVAGQSDSSPKPE